MAIDRPEYRLSDAERQEALDALAEHVRTGRLDVVEYDERSASISAARLRRDLEPVFGDLPEPRPSVLAPVNPPTAPAHPVPPAPTWQQRLATLAVPAAAVLAIVLFFTARVGIFAFVLPVAVALLAGTFSSRRRG